MCSCLNLSAFLSAVLVHSVSWRGSKSKRKLLHNCIKIVIVKHNLVQIGRIDGPIESIYYLSSPSISNWSNRWTHSSYTLAAITPLGVLERGAGAFSLGERLEEQRHRKVLAEPRGAPPCCPVDLIEKEVSI
jgi:hypothetical protein